MKLDFQAACLKPSKSLRRNGFIFALGLPFVMSCLLACGEPDIKTADDEVLEQAARDKAEAKQNVELAGLIGLWRACEEVPDAKSTLLEYAFSNKGKASVKKTNFKMDFSTFFGH